MVTLAKRLKRWLYLGHRWLGIATALLFVLWIGSGLVLLHVPFPRLTEAERLARLAPIDWADVTFGPDAALAGVPAHPHLPFSLEMRGPEPVYRISAADGTRYTFSARNGERLGPVSMDEARRLAGASDEAMVSSVLRDQWTVTDRYDPLRPFHKVALGDAAGTELYVSQRTGEIALDTTRFERGWNWIGAVVHWIYPTVLRGRPELWRDVVLWLSGLAILGALSGLAVGIWRMRLRRRFPHGRMTPYRGLARWHHLFGLAAGLFLTTYIISGWLSMNPNRWFSSPAPPEPWLSAYAGLPTPIGLEATGLQRIAEPAARRLVFSRVAGRWLVAVASPQATRVVGADGASVPDKAAIAAAARDLVPDGRLASVERLEAYDAYWYPQGEAPPLPALRLRYDDPAGTWLHIDLAGGAILNRLDGSGRVNRLLFDALHRLDLPVLVENQTARLAAQWLLNGLAAVIAMTGLIGGWRRLLKLGPKYWPGH